MLVQHGQGDPQEETLAMLSAALDEIYWLRGALLYEARACEAELARYRSVPIKARRAITNSVRRMRRAVSGEAATTYAGLQDIIDIMRAHSRDTLTRTQWEAEVAERRRQRLTREATPAYPPSEGRVMSYVTNIMLTARYIPDADIEKVTSIDLAGREGSHQCFVRMNDSAVGGGKVWEADTFAAAVNHMRPLDEILDALADAITYGADVTLIVHREDAGDFPEIYFLHFDWENDNHWRTPEGWVFYSSGAKR